MGAVQGLKEARVAGGSKGERREKVVGPRT